MGSGATARRGFTLVEVLASLALVGAVLLAALTGVSVAMGLGRSAVDLNEAATLASGTLAEVMATGTWRTGAAEGSYDLREGGEPRYAWGLDVVDWEEPGVQQVTVTVTWTARGRERRLQMSTLAYAEGD